MVDRCRRDLAATSPEARAEDVEQRARPALLEAVRVPPQWSWSTPAPAST